MAELQKIKAEKAVEEREREDERREDEEKIRMENILAGNPLLKERYVCSIYSSMKNTCLKQQRLVLYG